MYMWRESATSVGVHIESHACLGASIDSSESAFDLSETRARLSPKHAIQKSLLARPAPLHDRDHGRTLDTIT